MSKEPKNLSKGQIATLLSTFVLMCVVRLPVTLFILFGFALSMTFVTGRKNYCAGYCPLGAVQDYLPPKANPPKQLPPLVNKLRWPVFTVFWAYLAYVTVVSFASPEQLWRSILLLMILSMASALFLHTTLRTRLWCSKVCPFGKVLDGAVKVRRSRLFP